MQLLRGCSHGCRAATGLGRRHLIARPASGAARSAGSTLLRIVSGADKRIEAVEIADASMRMHRIATRRLVLACGAVETPRVLLLQRLGGPQVGRNFLESVSWTSVADAGEPLLSFGGLPADAISWDRNRPDATPGVIGGFRLSAAIRAT